MKVVDRYILLRILGYASAFAGIALLVLLLERMLRLMDLAVSHHGTLGHMARMMLSLIPHYLEIALPSAFFLAILLAVHHMCENGELTALHGAGVGLPRLLAPVTFMGVVVAAAALVTLAYIQPHARYAYRGLVHQIAHQSLAAVAREGTFVSVDNHTFMAGRHAPENGALETVFVYTERAGGRSAVTTASHGALRPARDGGSVLALDGGAQTIFDKDGAISGNLAFDALRWNLGAGAGGRFRARGKDVREMTLSELARAPAGPVATISPARISAELNRRLAGVVTILVLPLLAIPFGLTTGRVGRSAGVVAGLIVLVVHQKSVKFGASLAGEGAVPAWLGTWLPFACLALLGAVLFARAACGVAEPPLAVLARYSEDLLRRLPRP